jgi:hypothetical protein
MKQIYKVVIDRKKKKSMGRISLVKNPANQTLFIAMNNESEINLLLNEEQQIVTGPVLIPDQKIWRNEINGYITFDKETIKELQNEFSRNSNLMALNIEHTEENASGSYVIETWLSGSKDKSQELGYNLPEGTWFMTTKIEDNNLWNKIKNGELGGFSIEAIVDLTEIKMNKQMEIKMKEWVLEGDIKAYTEEETPVVGTMIYSDPEMTLPLEDGEYKIELLTLIVVSGSISEIKTEDSEEIIIDMVMEPDGIETEEEFLGRCIPYEINNGYDDSQASAICYSKYNKIDLSIDMVTESGITESTVIETISIEDFNMLKDYYSELLSIVGDLQQKFSVMESEYGNMINKTVEMNEQIIKLTVNTPENKRKITLSNQEIEDKTKSKFDRIDSIISHLRK